MMKVETGGPLPPGATAPPLAVAPAPSSPAVAPAADVKKKSVEDEAATNDLQPRAAAPARRGDHPNPSPAAPAAAAPRPETTTAPRPSNHSAQPGEPIDLAKAVKAWLEFLERQSFGDKLVLSQCAPEAGARPNLLALAYPDDYNPNNLSDLTKLKSKVQDALRQSLDQPALTLELRAKAIDPRAVVVSSSRHIERLGKDPDVRRAMDMFELKVISVEVDAEESDSSNDPDDD